MKPLIFLSLLTLSQAVRAEHKTIEIHLKNGCTAYAILYKTSYYEISRACPDSPEQKVPRPDLKSAWEKYNEMFMLFDRDAIERQKRWDEQDFREPRLLEPSTTTELVNTDGIREIIQGPVVANYHWPFDVKKGDPITQEQCESLGGHFWSTGTDPFTQAYSGFNGTYFRTCGLCGKKQARTSTAPVIPCPMVPVDQWEDVRP